MTFFNSRILAPCLVACLLSGCASVTQSHTEPLTINATQNGKKIADANCSLKNNKGAWSVMTPGIITVHKSFDDMTVTCTKKGLKDGSIAVRSTSNGATLGNVAIPGGAVGYAIDASTGAGFDYPADLTVEMGKTASLKLPAPAQAPSRKVAND